MSEQTERQWKIKIDDQVYETTDPVLTGRQLLDIAGKRPVEEHLVYFLDKINLLEDISLEETVDLRERGIERFLTFRNDRSYRFELDGRRQDWGAAMISEPTLRKLAGVGDEYRVWLERRGQEDKQLAPGDIVSLEPQGVERFYTGRDDTNAGATTCLIPQADRRYVDEHELSIEEVVEGQQKGIIIKGYALPAGRFDAEAADILILLPAGYPDAVPDMFFTDPWLKLKSTGAYPNRAATAFNFNGRRWQRWSRHNSAWRAGQDGIQTMLRRIDRALRSE
jgi:hypothetical protein